MGENGQRHLTFVVARFRDTLFGLPTSWVPSCVSPSPTPSPSDYEPPISLMGGFGQVGSTLAGLSMVEPTSLNRREGLVAGWMRVDGGEWQWKGRW